MKRILMATITIYSLLFNTAFAKNRPKFQSKFNSRFLIKSYVKDYSRRIEQDIAQYNKLRKDPKGLLKTFPKKDHKPLLDILNKYQIKELPEIKHKQRIYQAVVGKNKLEFDLVSLYKNSIKINGKIFNFTTNDYKEFERIRSTFKLTKKTSFMNIGSLFIEEVHAGLFIASLLTLAATGVILGYYMENKVEEIAINKQMRAMNGEISKLVNQCEKDKPLAKHSPKETLETLSLLSLFTSSDNELQTSKLENHLYKALAGKNVQFQGVIDEDPISCEKFSQYIRNSLRGREVKQEKEKEKNGEGLQVEICNQYNALEACLKEFDENFRISGENRYIDYYTEDYVPQNTFLKDSLSK